MTTSPTIGTRAVIIIGADRYPSVVTDISRDGKRITLGRLNHNRIGVKPTETASHRADGSWKLVGNNYFKVEIGAEK